MEERKLKEIEYYNKSAKSCDFENFTPFVLKSYQELKRITRENCKGKKILDYGCGNGIHSAWLKNCNGEVTGVDLSEESLKIARDIVPGVEFLKMDCENLDFPDNSFDLVFDGGTFSSLDIDKAFSEIRRVLKPGGVLIGIETLGHNPFTNLKRKINRIRKKRTAWAEGHIFRMKDLKKAEEYFEIKEVHFFHILSLIAFPFLNFRTGRIILKILEKGDRVLISVFPFLKRYCFKIVFVFFDKKAPV